MKSVRILMFALLLTVLTTGAAFAQVINFVNTSSDTIAHMGLVHESNSSDEVVDLLGEEVLSPNTQISIEISGPASGWTLILADPEGNEYPIEGIDFTGVTSFIMSDDGVSME